MALRICVDCNVAEVPPKRGRVCVSCKHLRRKHAEKEPFPKEGRTCTICGEVKMEDDFHAHPNGKYGRSPDCKPCAQTAKRLAKYSLSMEEYKGLIAAQGGKCAICYGDLIKLHVDHDHACCPGNKSCGKCVRGLLCRECNWMLGNARDDKEVLKNAIEYLEDYEV